MTIFVLPLAAGSSFQEADDRKVRSKRGLGRDRTVWTNADVVRQLGATGETETNRRREQERTAQQGQHHGLAILASGRSLHNAAAPSSSMVRRGVTLQATCDLP